MPIDDILSMTSCFAPAAMASIEITAATPIITPSIARKERSLFAKRLFNAILIVVIKGTFTSSPVTLVAYDLAVFHP